MTTLPFQKPRCDSCPIRKAEGRLCKKQGGKAPPDCPTANHERLTEEVCQTRYKSNPAVVHFARNTDKIERAGYRPSAGGGMEPIYPRIVEVVGFAKKMRYKKLGLIFCFGLRNEGAVVTEILETNGFTIVSACCNMCNPILQAELMNKAKVDFNIMLGLCVGHDSLALKNVEAPVTVLGVKDRRMGNTPLAAIYMYNSYMSYLKKPLPDLG